MRLYPSFFASDMLSVSVAVCFRLSAGRPGVQDWRDSGESGSTEPNRTERLERTSPVRDRTFLGLDGRLTMGSSAQRGPEKVAVLGIHHSVQSRASCQWVFLQFLWRHMPAARPRPTTPSDNPLLYPCVHPNCGIISFRSAPSISRKHTVAGKEKVREAHHDGTAPSQALALLQYLSCQQVVYSPVNSCR